MGVIFDTGVWVGVASGQIANETVMKTAGNEFNDLWIAAQAIEHSFPLMTTNPSDFQNLPGLDLKAI